MSTIFSISSKTEKSQAQYESNNSLLAIKILNAERLLTQQETQNYYNLRNACAGKPINEVINILKQ